VSDSEIQVSVVGAVDLNIRVFLAALEVEVADRYELEWRPGLAHAPAGTPVATLKWLSWESQGTWLVVPSGPPGLELAASLARRLDRALSLLDAEWFEESESSRLTTHAVSPTEPSTIESVEHHDGGAPEHLLHEAMGTVNCAPLHEHEFAVFVTSESAPSQSTEVTPREASVHQGRLQDVLSLVGKGASCELTREDPEGYLFRCRASGAVYSNLACTSGIQYEPDEVSQMSIYLNGPTGAALEAALKTRERPRADLEPSVWGFLSR